MKIFLSIILIYFKFQILHYFPSYSKSINFTLQQILLPQKIALICLTGYRKHFLFCIGEYQYKYFSDLFLGILSLFQHEGVLFTLAFALVINIRHKLSYLVQHITILILLMSKS